MTPALRLALRGLWWRRGVSAALLVVAVFVVAAAASGPVYLRAAGESLLRDGVATAGPSATGVQVMHLAAASERPGAALAAVLPAAGRWHSSSTALDRDVDLPVAGRGGDVRTQLVARDGVCAEARIRGRCPAAAGEVLLSAAAARRMGTAAGRSLVSDDGQALRVVGTYEPRDAATRLWSGFGYLVGAGATDSRGRELVDAAFTVDATLETAPPAALVRAVAELQPAPLVLADVERVRERVADATEALRAALPGVVVTSGLPELLDRVDRSSDLLRVPVLLVVLQLLVLAWLVLFSIVAGSVDSRGPEVALAKLRGLSTRATAGVGLLEPVLLLVAALPAGVLLGLLAVRAVAASQLADGTPVPLPGLALGAAGLAVLGGAVAAGLAARAVLARPALEQFRRTSPRGARRGWVADAAVLVLAAAGLVQLLVSGALRGGDVDPVALVAPGLLSLAVALLAARLLPAVCRALAGVTRGRSRVGLFLASRQVARRPSGARTVVVLVVAFGLAAFSVSAWSVARDNRHDVALTASGAERVVLVEQDAAAVSAAVREVDPAGRWAMPVSELVLLSSSRSGRRVLAVDSERLPAVAWWRKDFAGASLPDLASRLRPPAAAPVVVTGDGVAVRVRVDRLEVRGAPRASVHLTADLRDADGLPVSADLGPLPERAGELTGRAACADGCRLVALRLRPAGFADVVGSLVLQEVAQVQGGRRTAVDAGLLDASRWRPVADGTTPTLRVVAGGLALDVALEGASGAPGAGPADSPRPLPAVVTPSVAEGAREVTVPGLDRVDLPVRVAATAVALPRAQADGLLVDREYALRQVGPGGSDATEQVWLGAAAPADAVQRLERAGLTVTGVDSAAQEERALARQGPALALLLFLLGAVAAALLAAGGTVLDLYLQGRRRTGELSAVRALGVRRRALASALLLEQGLLVGTGAGAGVAVGLGAALLALPSVPQLDVEPEAPALLFVPDVGVVGALVAVALGLLAVAVVGTVLGLLRSVRTDRLREWTS